MDKWDSRFMEMAHVIAGWTSCYRPGRSIGCVIVKDKRIMTTGYNGAPTPDHPSRIRPRRRFPTGLSYRPAGF